jgi:mono/diheme cytochrome c family protein
MSMCLLARTCVVLLALASAPAAAGDAAAGETRFKQLCATCHGVSGKGDGPAAAALRPKPRDMSDAEWQASVDDAYLADIIKRGGAALGKSPLMTPFPALNEQQLKDIIAFIRTLD